MFLPRYTVAQKKNSEGSVIPAHHRLREPINVDPSSGSSSLAAASQNYQKLYPTAFPSSNNVPNYETAFFVGEENANYDLAEPLERDPEAMYEATIFPPNEEEEEQVYDEAGHVEEDGQEPLAYEVPAQSLQAHLSSQQISRQRPAPSPAQHYSESNPPIPQPRRRKGIKQGHYSLRSSLLITIC